MNSLLASKKKTIKSDLPDYLQASSQALKDLYRAFKSIESELEAKINSTEIDLSITERNILNSKVAERADRSESNFRRDRTVPAKIIEEIETANKRLELLYSTKVKKNTSGKHKSKSELEEEVESLRAEVKKLNNEKYQEFFAQLIDSQITQNQKRLAEKNKALELQVKQLEETIGNLRKQNAQYLRQLNTTS